MTANQLRRGFSDPGFEQGHQSEFDLAVEVVAKASESLASNGARGSAVQLN
jgi:16S rRNA G1207 methylase RsmC